MQYEASFKRRRVGQDQDYQAFVAPSTSRTAAKAAANGRAQEAARSAQQPKEESSTLLDLATLPPASLQRYLSRYGLLEAHGSLSYHHAVFPVPPLPATLLPPLTGRILTKSRSRPAHTLRYREHQEDDPNRGSAAESTTAAHQEAEGSGGAGGAGGAAGSSKNSRKCAWQEPKTHEFAELTAYDDPQVVVDRLAARAKVHWDKKDSVKEGETLTNFIFALRMRAHTLRATPPG